MERKTYCQHPSRGCGRPRQTASSSWPPKIRGTSARRWWCEGKSSHGARGARWTRCGVRIRAHVRACHRPRRARAQLSILCPSAVALVLVSVSVSLPRRRARWTALHHIGLCHGALASSRRYRRLQSSRSSRVRGMCRSGRSANGILFGLAHTVWRVTDIF